MPPLPWHQVSTLTKVEHHVGVSGDLDDGVNPAVADGETLEGDGHGRAVVGGLLGGACGDGGVLLVDLVTDGRHVVSAVALAGDVQVGLQDVREHLVELLQERVEVVGDLVLVGDIALAGAGVGEASSDGVVDEEHVVLVVPRVGVGDEVEVGVDVEGSHLDEHAEQGGAAGPTLQPDEGRGAGVAVLGREVPEEHVVVGLRGGVRGEETGVGGVVADLRRHLTLLLDVADGGAVLEEVGEDEGLVRAARRCGAVQLLRGLGGLVGVLLLLELEQLAHAGVIAAVAGVGRALHLGEDADRFGGLGGEAQRSNGCAGARGDGGLEWHRRKWLLAVVSAAGKWE